MSAAATAAGYLYASGRLRGRNAREQEDAHSPKDKPAPQEKIRVAVLPPEPPQEKAKRTPKIEYRTRRRWSAE